MTLGVPISHMYTLLVKGGNCSAEPFIQSDFHSIPCSQTHPHMGIHKVARADTRKLVLSQQVAGQPSHTHKITL